MAEARTTLRQYLLLCDRRLGDVDSRIDRIRADRLDVTECNTLATLAVWPAWNVVEGPDGRVRSDDPGDDFLDRYTHGITLKEFERMNSIEALHRKLAVIPLTGNITSGALRSLADAISLARPNLVSGDPIPFRESMWDRDSSGRWSKRRAGERFIPG